MAISVYRKKIAQKSMVEGVVGRGSWVVGVEGVEGVLKQPKFEGGWGAIKCGQ